MKMNQAVLQENKLRKITSMEMNMMKKKIMDTSTPQPNMSI
jgi:hypothetical protein